MVPTLTPATIVSRKPDLLTAEVNGEIVLMSVQDGLYFGLNAVSSDIWRRLETPVQVAALCRALADDYQGDPAVIERDVLDHLATLATKHLVEIRA